MPLITRNPDQLTPEEVTSEIKQLQDEIRVRGRRIYELAHSLYRRTRRSPTDDSTSSYIAYSNAVMRFAGAVEQVLQRTIRTARVLERLPKSFEGQESKENSKEVPKKERFSPSYKTSYELISDLSPAESLIESYINKPPEDSNED